MKNSIRMLIASAFVWLPACVTTPAETAPEKPQTAVKIEPVLIAYELRKSDWKRYGRPLPAKQNIYIDWYYSDESRRTQLAYRAWDFDEDGRYDLLESVGKSGAFDASLFDFTGNGKIDLIKRSE